MRTLQNLALLALLCTTTHAVRPGFVPGDVTPPPTQLEAGATQEPSVPNGQIAVAASAEAQAALMATTGQCCGRTLQNSASWMCGYSCVSSGTVCERRCTQFPIIGVTCNNGRWVGNQTCPTPGSCLPAKLPALIGGSWTGACSTSYDNTAPGTICTATCAAGFSGSPYGSPQTTCVYNALEMRGDWSGVTGSCNPSPASCLVTSAPTLANGAWNCSTAVAGVVASGRTCTAKCNTDYQGTSTITCLGGIWGPPTGACTLIPSGCPATGTGGPGALPANAASWNCAGLGTVPKNFACMARCAAGYTGTIYRTCTNSNTWGPVVGSCYRNGISCSTRNMPDVPLSRWDCDPAWDFNNPTAARPEQGCLATCLSNVGRPATSCNGQTGTWRTPVGACTADTVGVCPFLTLPRFDYIRWKCVAGANNGQVCLGSCTTGNAAGGIGNDVYIPCISGNWGYLGVPGRYVGTCPGQALVPQAARRTAAGVAAAATADPATVTLPTAVPVMPATVVTEAGPAAGTTPTDAAAPAVAGTP